MIREIILHDPAGFDNFSFRHRQPEVACAVAEEADNHLAVLVPLQGCTADRLEETLAAKTQVENSTKKLTN